MKEHVITFNQDQRVISTAMPYVGGLVTQGSWPQVARDLVESGWSTLKPGEYCRQLVITDEGIKLVIGHRTSA